MIIFVFHSVACDLTKFATKRPTRELPITGDRFAKKVGLFMTQAIEQDDVGQVVEAALGIAPIRWVRQGLSDSGNAVYRVFIPDDHSVVLRMSARPKTFAFSRHNLLALASLGLPVQKVLAAGATVDGGAYILLSWIPGRDLAHELPEMTPAHMTLLAEQIVHHQRRVGTLPEANAFGWAPIGKSGPLQRWTDLFGEPATPEALDDGTPIGHLRARLSRLRTAVEPYFATVRPTPFLDDVTTKNVIMHNHTLAGIIDVDFVCYGDPLLTVGSTMALLAADGNPAGAFYGEELARFWTPTETQQQAIRFYAALWTIGLLHGTDPTTHPDRAAALTAAADRWLNQGGAL
jgi:aminoglycoside phosphotransferase (APT) family kinase protein